jgi:hypothetical protein
MMPHHYEREPLAQAHRQHLLGEAELERLPDHLARPEQAVTLQLPARVALYFEALRTRLLQRG